MFGYIKKLRTYFEIVHVGKLISNDYEFGQIKTNLKIVCNK